jgi:hypothetical protein
VQAHRSDRRGERPITRVAFEADRMRLVPRARMPCWPGAPPLHGEAEDTTAVRTSRAAREAPPAQTGRSNRRERYRSIYVLDGGVQIRALGGVNVDDFAGRRWPRNRLATLLETLDVELDGISNQREGFRSCFTRSDTAGQIGYVCTK